MDVVLNGINKVKQSFAGLFKSDVNTSEPVDNEYDVLVKLYLKAKEDYLIAEHNFDMVDIDYSDVAILELQAKKERVNRLLIELKRKYHFQ